MSSIILFLEPGYSEPFPITHKALYDMKTQNILLDSVFRLNVSHNFNTYSSLKCSEKKNRVISSYEARQASEPLSLKCNHFVHSMLKKKKCIANFRKKNGKPVCLIWTISFFTLANIVLVLLSLQCWFTRSSYEILAPLFKKCELS